MSDLTDTTPDPREFCALGGGHLFRSTPDSRALFCERCGETRLLDDTACKEPDVDWLGQDDRKRIENGLKGDGDE